MFILHYCCVTQVGEKCRIRDRATILARHMYADMGERFADQQVGHTGDRGLGDVGGGGMWAVMLVQGSID